ncbi:MAG: ADP-ribosylglycohydrolase family protein [Cyanobacteria bacterium SBLK]|nr:ADP-ribosylglycohydrolase family protein [Cyanobacteria bacterium SBLK]
MSHSAPDRHKRIENALLSLEGLALGDAFGQCFFLPEETAFSLIDSRMLPDRPWYYTDDTVMAIGVVETLRKFGAIDRDYLAQAFAQNYQQEPDRGYGSTARKILREIGKGISWQEASGSAFDGMGSMGNGAAMRSAPIGAYFFDDYQRVVAEAKAASEVTHSHAEGQAGGIAVAVAAAYCARNQSPDVNGFELLENTVRLTPESETKSRLKQALFMAYPANIEYVIRCLGNGKKLCSFDTVPIALWLAAHNLDDFSEAIWQAVNVLGDRDTICAIVGSLVSLVTGREKLPQSWLECRETLAISVNLEVPLTKSKDYSSEREKRK